MQQHAVDDKTADEPRDEQHDPGDDQFLVHGLPLDCRARRRAGTYRRGRKNTPAPLRRKPRAAPPERLSQVWGTSLSALHRGGQGPKEPPVEAPSALRFEALFARLAPNGLAPSGADRGYPPTSRRDS